MKNIESLIRKANAIGAFFEAMPDKAQAVEGIADHIQKFWDPRMRHELLDFLREHPDGQADNKKGLKPLVVYALQENRDRLRPLVSS